MASSAAGVKADRPSFAKIAAAGLKPPSALSNSASHESTQPKQLPSSPSDGSNIVSHPNGSHPTQFTPKQKKLVPLMAKEQKVSNAADASVLEVSVQNVDADSAEGTVPRSADGTLGLAREESGTQISSSSGSGKPPSLDGKSVASGTTFALDEKESLRPDDSASVKGGEDEDLFSPPGSGMPSSRIGSEDGTRAFRDQLREISRMGPSRQAEPAPTLSRGPSQGVLYVPPQEPGVGAVPTGSRNEATQEADIDTTPDPRLLEALESPKDRIMVLKLEQDFVDFVKDPKEASLTLPQLNGYHRMLAHRLADYYMLGHVVEDSMAVQIYKTASCRLAPPLTGMAPPSTAASTPPPTGPQMKILRRGDNVGPTIANGSNAQSKNGSENGESGNDDDKKSKYPLSREEREAKYEAARKRIMGSAKPTETAEEASEKDNSRSSSTAPKKSKKKQRNDSDDDFEARSAYSAYYATLFTSAGPTQPPYGFANVGSGHEAQMAQSSYMQQAANASAQQYAGAGASWQNQTAYQQQPHSPSPWMSNGPQQYDLNNDFQRAMSLQSPSVPTPQGNPHAGWQAHQQYGGSQQQWQGPSPYSPAYSGQATHPFADNLRPSSSSSHAQNQQYAYGQLPSQTFPGRPPSNLEHPLPGSYKGKHFNPQSQSFVPNFNAPHAQAMPVQAFMSQVPQAGSPQYGTYGVPGMAPQQQPKGYQQPGSFQPQTTFHPQQQQRLPFQHQQQPSPLQHQHPSHNNGQTPQQTTVQPSPYRSPGQPLTHPLPQPVFPRQPSPNMPLPPKPGATPPRAQDQSASSSYGQDGQQKESSIARWGAPPSLPAKPPPANEPFDPARFAQNQRQSSHGSNYGQVTAGTGGRS